MYWSKCYRVYLVIWQQRTTCNAVYVPGLGSVVSKRLEVSSGDLSLLDPLLFLFQTCIQNILVVFRELELLIGSSSGC